MIALLCIFFIQLKVHAGILQLFSKQFFCIRLLQFWHGANSCTRDCSRLSGISCYLLKVLSLLPLVLYLGKLIQFIHMKKKLMSWTDISEVGFSSCLKYWGRFWKLEWFGFDINLSFAVQTRIIACLCVRN